MARFSGGWRTAGAGSTTLPIASLYATAAINPRIIEVGVFNTTATAVSVALRRLTSVGTAGTGRDELPVDDPARVAVSTLVDTHTVAPTITAGAVRAGTLGASIGSGVIWTFTEPLVVPSGTTNGIGIIPLTGTGQVCDIYIEWFE